MCFTWNTLQILKGANDMMRDRFLDAIRCDRCGKSLESGKIETPNGDVICIKCLKKTSKTTEKMFYSRKRPR